MVFEDELRRYLRHASVLLAISSPPAPQRLSTLLRARHWVAAVLAGVDQLVREAETADTLDPPLTPIPAPGNIEAD